MCTVKPNPHGPLRMIIGGFRLVTSGLSSRQGDVSLEEAVDDPPGDSIGWVFNDASSKKCDFVIKIEH